jgi:hypothetical protein
MSNDPPDRESGPADEPGVPQDALSRLERRLERASDAADRLIAQATGSTRKPPPAGWQRPPDDDHDQPSDSRASGDIELLLGVIHSLRELLPPELQRRLAEALRELLLAIRGVIDWYLERSELRRAEPTEVQDIPIL